MAKERRRAKISQARMALIILAQLRALAGVHRARGEILSPASWLKAIANVLSSAPAGYMGSRRGRNAPTYFFGLTFENLKAQAEACGFETTDEEIEGQVFETQEWRQRMTTETGAPFYRRMNPHKMGALLGVTPQTREEAQAWNIGVYGGSQKQQEQAARERDRLRKTLTRRDNGMQTWAQRYSQNLSAKEPWKTEGISRRTWYRRRHGSEDGTAVSATSSANTDLAQPCPAQPCPRPLVERGTAVSAPSSSYRLRPRNCPDRQLSDGGEAVSLMGDEPPAESGEISATLRMCKQVGRAPKAARPSPMRKAAE